MPVAKPLAKPVAKPVTQPRRNYSDDDTSRQKKTKSVTRLSQLTNSAAKGIAANEGNNLAVDVEEQERRAKKRKAAPIPPKEHSATRKKAIGQIKCLASRIESFPSSEDMSGILDTFRKHVVGEFDKAKPAFLDDNGDIPRLIFSAMVKLEDFLMSWDNRDHLLHGSNLMSLQDLRKESKVLFKKHEKSMETYRDKEDKNPVLTPVDRRSLRVSIKTTTAAPAAQDKNPELAEDSDDDDDGDLSADDDPHVEVEDSVANEEPHPRKLLRPKEAWMFYRSLDKGYKIISNGYEKNLGTQVRNKLAEDSYNELPEETKKVKH